MTEEELDFEDAERSYRRGYTHGAWEVMAAVNEHLPAEVRDRLERWFAKGAVQWRRAAYVGESARSPGRHVTMDIVPPKIGWPF